MTNNQCINQNLLSIPLVCCCIKLALVQLSSTRPSHSNLEFVRQIKIEIQTFFLALPPPSFFLAGALLGVFVSFPPFFGGLENTNYNVIVENESKSN